MKKDIVSLVKNRLAEGESEKIPTSGFGRIGRMALTALSSTSLMAKAARRGDDDVPLDAEKIVKLVTSVGRLKGIAMKMGQIMSYIDVALPEEFQEALSVLQTQCQPMAFNTVETVIREDLGERADALLARMDPVSLSAASIGQVHRSVVDGREVAVKVQYPEIKRAIESDFSPAAFGTKFASLLYPGARIDGYVNEARDRFLEECNYRHEGHCQQLFGEIYNTHPVLFVPRVYPSYSATRVLTTELIHGKSFAEFLVSAPSQEVRNRVGEALFEFYIGSLFRHRIYNCDPHPGNYLFCDDGRVAMLDHGCTRQFEGSFVADIAFLTKAVHRDEQAMLHAALRRLDIVREGKKYDYQIIRSFLRGFFGAMLNDKVQKVSLESAMEMKEIFKKKVQLMKFSLPGEFTFLFRIRFGLMSVLSRLGAEANWYRLEKRFVDEFEADHPILLS